MGEVPAQYATPLEPLVYEPPSVFENWNRETRNYSREEFEDVDTYDGSRPIMTGPSGSHRSSSGGAASRRSQEAMNPSLGELLWPSGRTSCVGV